MFSSEPEERGDKIVTSNKKGLIIVGISIAIIIVAVIIIVVVVISNKNKEKSKKEENQGDKKEDTELEVYKKYEKLEKLGQGVWVLYTKEKIESHKKLLLLKKFLYHK